MPDFLHQLPQFLGHHAMLATLFVGIVAALVVIEIRRLFRGYRELTPAALTLLINRESPLLVDLSNQPDFEKGHIAGAKHVVMSQFDPEQKDLAKVKELPVAVYCKNGTSSAQASARLVRAGFKHVFMLSGGLNGWKQAGMPTTRGNK